MDNLHKPKHLLKLNDLSKSDLLHLIQRTGDFKNAKRTTNRLHAATVAMLFDKKSTRTRVAFQVAAHRLGMGAIYIDPNDTQLDRNETIADTAKVLSSYLHAIIIRTYEQQRLNTFAQHSKVPVINGLTDAEHPTQIVSDLFTILESRQASEKKINLNSFRLTYLGDPNNVTNSLIAASEILGFELTIACPKGYEPKISLHTNVKITNDPKAAVIKADVIYTDVWVSMARPTNKVNKSQKLQSFQNFQLNSVLLKASKNNPLIMHCLPAHRGEEITDEVLHSKNSIVFRQAENKLYSAQAILEHFVK